MNFADLPIEVRDAILGGTKCGKAIFRLASASRTTREGAARQIRQCGTKAAALLVRALIGVESFVRTGPDHMRMAYKNQSNRISVTPRGKSSYRLDATGSARAIVVAELGDPDSEDENTSTWKISKDPQMIMRIVANLWDDLFVDFPHDSKSFHTSHFIHAPFFVQQVVSSSRTSQGELLERSRDALVRSDRKSIRMDLAALRLLG